MACTLLALSAAVLFCGAVVNLVEDRESLRIIFWPAARIADFFPPPCFDRGHGEEPFCEATPVQAFAGLLGMGVSVLVYALIAYGLLRLSFGRSGAARTAA